MIYGSMVLILKRSIFVVNNSWLAKLKKSITVLASTHYYTIFCDHKSIVHRKSRLEDQVNKAVCYRVMNEKKICGKVVLN